MNPSLDQLRQWLKQQRPLLLQQLVELLKIPSISTDPSYHSQVVAAHDWLKAYLERIGFTLESIPTPRYPVLIAKRHLCPELPTLLIYNHYDVQPADPLEEWKHPPFDPYIDPTGEIYARGAQDNKGQLWAVVQAIEALLAYGELPCNVTLCIEGEEESGSVGLRAALPSISSKLKADALFVVDVDIPSKKRPAVTLGIRGNITMTLELTAAKSDLHSGMHGGILLNPNHVLVELLAQLRDPSTGRVRVEGFYDDVVALNDQERAHLSLQFNAYDYEQCHGAKPSGGEQDYSPLERCWLRPTLEINGISGGYAGEGFKTVIPAKAMAKLSCRLVPNQDPATLIERVKRHILSLVPEGVEAKIVVHGAGRWLRAPAMGPAAAAVRHAYEEVFALPCESIMSGGSVPIIAELAEAAGAEVVLLGYGLPEDQIHAPNEHYGTDRLLDLACVIALAMQYLNPSRV